MSGLLVTGAGGFTGQHLCKRAVDAGFVVHALGRSIGVPGVIHRDVDIRDPAAVDAVVRDCEPDRVIHLAAISHVSSSLASAYYEVNVIGALNLVDALARVGRDVTSVLIASSAQVYGQPESELVDEATLPQPINHYGASKLAMEHLVRTYADRLPINIVRPFNYTGSGQSSSFLVPKIIEHFAKRKSTIELGNIDVFREINDVASVVDLYLKIVSSDIRGEILNICSGIGHSPREILNLLFEITGHRISVEINPKFIRANELKRLVGSDAHLVDRVGPLAIRPLEVTLAEMLASTQSSLRTGSQASS